MSEITAVADAAKEYCKNKNNWIILPLHSTLSIADQDNVISYIIFYFENKLTFIYLFI